MPPYLQFGAALGALIAIQSTPAHAADSRKLTLERVFASPDLAGPQPRALKLSPDGTLVTLLKPRADEKERLDLWAIDTRTGAERMLVDSKKTGSGAALSEAEKMQQERDRFIKDRHYLLKPTDQYVFVTRIHEFVKHKRIFRMHYKTRSVAIDH